MRGVDLMLGLVALSRSDLVAARDHIAVALESRGAHGFAAAAVAALPAVAAWSAWAGQSPPTGRVGALG